MNYRHAFHAGNFADIVKHAALLAALEAMADGPPLTVVDTHGGAGAYDLSGEMAARSGEAEGGVGRLMADPAAPAVLAPLKAAVERLNKGGPARLYPGSPLLAAQALRPADRLVACELRPDDHALLARTLAPYPNARALQADGYPVAAEAEGRLLVLIDPPFERPDDYERAAGAMAAVLRRSPGACVMVWLPLKDLETFDAFLRRVEDLAPVLVAEVRLRPLTDPMRMNGCALVIAGAPSGLEEALADACAWIAGAEGTGRVWRLAA